MMSSRRARFLGSVAALGLVVAGAGAGAYQHVAASPMTAPARAAAAVQHPAGFADLVAKVKPAVVAVQVKMDEAAAKTAMNDQQNGTESPMQRFFRQFDNR